MSLHKKSSSIFLSAILFFGFAIMSVNASFDLQAWQYYRNIEISNSSEFAKIILPENISKGASDFSDIRIISNDNIEIPYFLTKNTIVRGGEVSTNIINQTTNAGITSLIVDTGSEGMIHTGIRLDASVPNFRRNVTIYSSSSLLDINSSSWNKVIDTGFIYKLSDPNSNFTSGKNFVDFPANTGRYLKIVIGQGTEGPINISSTSIYSDVHIDIPAYEKNVLVSTFNNPNKKTTEIIIDLLDSGKITNSITIDTTDKNYSRKVIIESSNATSSDAWRYVSQDSISNVSTALFTGKDNRIDYPEQKTRYIKISIVNDDNRPLKITSNAKIEGPIVSAIFETRSGESYRLFYGNSNAQKSNYDISRISSYIETNSLPTATLSSEIPNSDYKAPAEPIIPFTEANPWLFNTLLIILVIIFGAGIGWYLFKYMKK